MTQIVSTFRRDANRVPIWTDGIVVKKEVEYAAGTTGAIGEIDLFEVTGTVSVKVFAVCSDDLTSAGTPTIEVGIDENTAAIIAQTTATNIDEGEIWLDATPATVENMPTAKIVSGTDIEQKIASATITGGKLTYFCVFTPISEDGNVKAV
jgi:hypothetical protein